MTGLLDEIMAKLNALPPKEQKAISKMAFEATKDMKFIPNAGPQTDAYLSKADWLLYGGSAGGGKSMLGLGLSVNAHERSLVMRREYSALGGLTEDLIKIVGTRDGFRGGGRPLMRLANQKLVEFGACANPGDEESWQGQPHDLIFFDELVQFLEDQVRFLITWNRTTTKGQRCRVVMASNPPVSSQGDWVIGMFRPWLDITYSKPAKSGELRWFVTDPDDRDVEVDGPTPVSFPGHPKPVIPKSRTFIQAFVRDNPYYAGTDYEATLDTLRGDMRAAMRDGNFMAARRDRPDQLIPTAWILEAINRWRPQPPTGVPMCCMGVDIAQGGEDNTVIAMRHDYWFAPLLTVPGKQTPLGSDVAGLIVGKRRDGADVVLDMGGGFGGGPYEILQNNGIEVTRYMGSEASTRRTVDKQLAFYNKRSEAYWRFREALDPDQPNGSPMALPNDPELIAELTTPTYVTDIRGIKVQNKVGSNSVSEVLGRSPDKADAVIMCWYGGPKGYDAMQALSAEQGPRKRVGGVPGRMPRVVAERARR